MTDHIQPDDANRPGGTPRNLADQMRSVSMSTELESRLLAIPDRMPQSERANDSPAMIATTGQGLFARRAFAVLALALSLLGIGTWLGIHAWLVSMPRDRIVDDPGATTDDPQRYEIEQWEQELAEVRSQLEWKQRQLASIRRMELESKLKRMEADFANRQKTVPATTLNGLQLAELLFRTADLSSRLDTANGLASNPHTREQFELVVSQFEDNHWGERARQRIK